MPAAVGETYQSVWDSLWKDIHEAYVKAYNADPVSILEELWH